MIFLVSTFISQLLAKSVPRLTHRAVPVDGSESYEGESGFDPGFP